MGPGFCFQRLLLQSLGKVLLAQESAGKGGLRDLVEQGQWVGRAGDPGGQSKPVQVEDGARVMEIRPVLGSLDEEEGTRMARRPGGGEVALVTAISSITLNFTCSTGPGWSLFVPVVVNMQQAWRSL